MRPTFAFVHKIKSTSAVSFTTSVGQPHHSPAEKAINRRQFLGSLTISHSHDTINKQLAWDEEREERNVTFH